MNIKLFTHPLRAVAASVSVLLLLAATLIGTAAGPVLASPNEMATLHRDLVSGKAHALPVNSVSEANAVLTAKAPGTPKLPQLSSEHSMLCCMKAVKDKKIALLLLQEKGVPVTLAVASAHDMKLPKSRTLSADGVTYRIESSGKLHMIMTERNGKWLCLIGELPLEDLMKVAGALKP